ncbi:MAG TPA: hypothetical protein VIG99_27240 [Myxococcaceae bacterium]|jgi:ligand-binding SRPBCC domain-containing protein
MKLRLSTDLEAPPDEVWEAVQRPSVMQQVARPLMRIESADGPFPERWADGTPYQTRLFLLGVLPVGGQRIQVTRHAEGPARMLRDDGGGGLAKRWLHVLRVEPRRGGGTRYTDTVDLSAGVLTPFVWAFTQLLFRYRQARFRRYLRRAK